MSCPKCGFIDKDSTKMKDRLCRHCGYPKFKRPSKVSKKSVKPLKVNKPVEVSKYFESDQPESSDHSDYIGP